MEYVDTHLSVKQAQDAVLAINPDAVIVRIWMGDTWPRSDVRRLVWMTESDFRWIPMEPNPDADSLIEFSDGHMIVARTYEQGTGNPGPRFGKARNGVGSSGGATGGTTRKSKRKAKRH